MSHKQETDQHATPYLSVVVTTRNDDHGGDPLKRLQTFVNCFDEQCRRTGLDAEVIVVEWNPPSERPRVSSLLRVPVPSSCTYRFIDVPRELHERLRYADVLPMFQMIAKNVGIRRSRGRFVLATNIDIIFSNELVARMATGQLQPGLMYRVDRHDIQAAVPVDAPLDEQMKYCAEHQLRVHAKWGSCAVDPKGGLLALNEDIVDGSTVRLGSGWHVREGDAATGFYRWVTGRAQVHVEPSADATDPAGALLEIEFEPNPHQQTSPVEIEIIVNDQTMARTTIARRGVFRLPLEGGCASSTLELRVKSAPNDGRRPLAVFERRSDMHYVVRSIRLRSLGQIREREAFRYPPEGWHVTPDPLLELERTGDELSVVTAPRQWSYCLQYGPLRARRSGTHRFVVMTEILEGGLSLGVLAGHQRFWLPSSVEHVRTTRDGILGVSVSLESGDRFWLMLSNDHPNGEGISRFVVKELTGSAEFGRVIALSRRQGISRSGMRAREEADFQREARATNGWSNVPGDPGVQPSGHVTDRAPSSSRRLAQACLARIERRKHEKQVRVPHALQFSVNGWRAGSGAATLIVEHGDTGVSVVTERRKWSYCLEYGPLSAPATGTYRFDLDCQVYVGGARLGILSGDRQSWLRSESTGTITAEGRTITVSARLKSGQAFWLMVYNDHPDGDGESRLLVKRVAASVDLRDVLLITGRAIARAFGLLIDPNVIVTPRSPTAHAMDRWRAADAPAPNRLELIDGRMSATTAREKLSYCIEYGPMRAAAAGTYQFRLTYELNAGGIILGVLGGNRKKWLRSSSREAIHPDSRTVTVTVPLNAGRLFWLVVSNNHPDGDGISRFKVQALTSAFVPVSRREAWRRALREQWAAIETRAIAALRRTLETVARSLSRIGPVASLLIAVTRLRDGVRQRIVNSSPEYQAVQDKYRALEEKVQEGARLRDLDGLYKLLEDHPPDAVHLNACGDFQLMAREHWMLLCGYPEFETFSMNIDATLSYMANAAGVREHVLDAPIYHLEHEIGSGWSPEGEALLRQRIAERGITWVEARDVHIWAAYMRWLGRPMIFNGPDWGLFNTALAETRVSPMDARTRSASG